MMLKHYTLPALFTVIAASATAKGLVDLEYEGNSVNQQMITVYGSADSLTLEADVFATLQGNVSRTVNVRRYELEVLPGSFNYFCWGVCYGGILAGSQYMWQSLPQHAIALSPGVAVNNFHAYVQPEHSIGIAKFRYVWFDVDQPNDSDWVDIVFDTTPGAGIHENGNVVNAFSAYPVPSLDGQVDLRYDLATSAGAEMAVYSLLGTEVRRASLSGKVGSVHIEQGDLGAGIYFANLVVDGRAVATRRFVFGSR